MSTHEHVPKRIGDAERDQATSLLTDHLVAGRLTQPEFDDRVSAALNARTADELKPLFSDLPGPKPGVVAVPQPTLQEQTRSRAEELMAESKARGEVESAPERRSKALVIASGIAWPLTFMLCFIVGWEHVWWLIFIPIALSSMAGKRHVGRHGGHAAGRRELDQ